MVADLLAPVLVLCGAVVACCLGYGVAGVAALTRRRPTPPALLGATTVVALVGIGTAGLGEDRPVGFAALVFCAGALLVALAMVRLVYPGLYPRPRLTAPALLAAALALALAGSAGDLLARLPSLARVLPSPPTSLEESGRLYRYAHAPRFTISYPWGWTTSPQDEAANRRRNLVALFITNNAKPARTVGTYVVVGFPLRLHPNLSTVLADVLATPGRTMRITWLAQRGGWRIARYSADQRGYLPIVGPAWQRVVAGNIWILYGAANSDVDGRYEATYDAMTRSWAPRVLSDAVLAMRASGYASAREEAHRPLAQATTVGADIALTLIGGLLILVLVRWRRQSSPRRPRSALVGATALSMGALFVVALANWPALFALAGGELGGLANSDAYLSPGAVRALAGLMTLAAIVVVLARGGPNRCSSPLLARLLGTNAALLGLGALVALYRVAPDALPAPGLALARDPALVAAFAALTLLLMKGRRAVRVGLLGRVGSPVLLVAAASAALGLTGYALSLGAGASTPPVIGGEDAWTWVGTGALALGLPVLLRPWLVPLTRALPRWEGAATEEHAGAQHASEPQPHGQDAHEHGASAEGGHVHGAAAEEEDEDEGLVVVLRERAISLSTMNRPLRLITGLAIAQILVTAVLIATRGLPMPRIAVAVVENNLVELPAPIFWTCVAFLALSWSYLLAGVLHAHPLVRGAGLALFAYVFAQHLDLAVLPDASVAWSGVVLAALGALPLIALLGLALDYRAERAGRHDSGHQRRVRAPTFFLLLAAFAVFYGAAWETALAARTPLLFGSLISKQLQGIQDYLIPMLFLAGLDLADWATVSGERVAGVVRHAGTGARGHILLALVGLAAGAAILVTTARADNGIKLVAEGIGWAVVAALVLVIAWRARPARGWIVRFPYLALAGSAAAIYVLAVVAALLVQRPVYNAFVQETPRAGGMDLTVYRRPSRPVFSLEYPQPWGVAVQQEGGDSGLTQLTFSSAGGAEKMALITFPNAELAHLTAGHSDFLAAWLAVNYPAQQVRRGPARADGPWSLTAFTVLDARGAPVAAGLARQRQERGRFWFQGGTAGPDLLTERSGTRDIFAAMAHTWTPTLLPPKTVPAQSEAVQEVTAGIIGQRLQALLGAAWLLIALAATTIVLLRSRLGRGGLASSGAVFVALMGLQFFVYTLPDLGAVLALPWLAAAPLLTIPSLQACVALALLAVSAASLVRHGTASLAIPLTLLLGVGVALVIVHALVGLYQQAMEVGARFTLAQATVIVLALLWDVTMSGETLTNGSGRLFPRHARVMLFFGYIMLVACAVLYFSSFHVQATGAGVEAQFESEAYPRQGLLFLGVPFVVGLLALRLSNWWATGRVRPAADAQTALVPESPQDDEQCVVGGDLEVVEGVSLDHGEVGA